MLLNSSAQPLSPVRRAATLIMQVGRWERLELRSVLEYEQRFQKVSIDGRGYATLASNSNRHRVPEHLQEQPGEQGGCSRIVRYQSVNKSWRSLWRDWPFRSGQILPDSVG
jgi:hypothetical protein